MTQTLHKHYIKIHKQYYNTLHQQHNIKSNTTNNRIIHELHKKTTHHTLSTTRYTSFFYKKHPQPGCFLNLKQYFSKSDRLYLKNAFYTKALSIYFFIFFNIF